MKRYTAPSTTIVEITTNANMLAASGYATPTISGNSGIHGIGDPTSTDAPTTGGFGDAKRYDVWADDED